jgi:hypothetical protein
MDEPKETLHQIGDSVGTHSQKDLISSYPSKAIARVDCTLTHNKGVAHIQNFWLTNGDTIDRAELS